MVLWAFLSSLLLVRHSLYPLLGLYTIHIVTQIIGGAWCSLDGYNVQKKNIVREGVLYTSFICHTSDIFVCCHIILMIGQNYAVYRKVRCITKVLTS